MRPNIWLYEIGKEAWGMRLSLHQGVNMTQARVSAYLIISIRPRHHTSCGKNQSHAPNTLHFVFSFKQIFVPMPIWLGFLLWWLCAIMDLV